ncbi:MAG: hypothetical protein ACM3JC_03380 [Rudaea sp.]
MTRFWVVSRKTRIRIAGFGVVALVAILVITAAALIQQRPASMSATTPAAALNPLIPDALR